MGEYIMKLKKRLLGGALALSMLAGSFFMNAEQANAATNPAGAPADWAFEESSVPLHDAILVKYPTVDTDTDGYISKTEAASLNTVNLAGQGLEGTINGIENFTNITSLYLQSNNFTGELPVGFTNLTNLEQLNIAANQFSGEIPTGIGNLVNLKNLYLHKNAFTGEIPAEIGNLSHLIHFMVQANQLTGGIPEELGSLTELQVLGAADNNLGGEIPSSFSGLLKLTTIDLGGNNLSGNVDAIKLLPLISAIQLRDNPELTGNPIFDLASNTTLNYLDVRGTSLIQARPNIATLQVANGGTFLYDNLAANLLNLTKDNFSDTFTPADIEKAEATALFISDPVEKAQWESDIALAKQMLEAKTEVEALLTVEGDNLATDVTQTEIDAAQEKVDNLPEGSLKNELQAKIDLAQQMLDTTAQVDALLTADDANLETGITQTEIDAAQIVVNVLPDGALKNELQARIAIAQKLLDAKGLVGTLLAENKTVLGTGVTQGTIEAAQIAVTALPDGDTKTALQADIDLAQKMLDTKAQVDALLTADGANLETGITQTEIDAAQTAVNVLPDGALKNELQAKIDTAQALLDATKLVDKLLTDDKANLESGVTQGLIDQDRAIVNALPDGKTKTDLLADIDLAQKILDADKSTKGLFGENGKILDRVNQDTINQAKELVNGLPEGATKDELLSLIAEAQKQLDAKNSVKPIPSGGSTSTMTNVNTGDDSNYLGYIILLLVALAGLGFVVRRKHIKQ